MSWNYFGGFLCPLRGRIKYKPLKEQNSVPTFTFIKLGWDPTTSSGRQHPVDNNSSSHPHWILSKKYLKPN